MPPETLTPPPREPLNHPDAQIPTVTDRIEEKVREGDTTFNLISWVKDQLKCDRDGAIEALKKVTTEIADNVKEVYGGDRILALYMDLYERAREDKRYRDAESILWKIYQISNSQGIGEPEEKPKDDEVMKGIVIQQSGDSSGPQIKETRA